METPLVPTDNGVSDGDAVALIAVMGLPGSGKTTMCRLLCRGVSAPAVACCVHVEFDEFVPDPTVSAVATCSDWKRDRGRLLKSLDRLLAARRAPGAATYFSSDGADSAADGGPLDSSLSALLDSSVASQRRATPHRRLVLLLDDNFYYASMRHAVFQLARFYRCGFGTVHLKASPGRLKLVNALREKPVSDGVIERMFERLEAPNSQRNAWERFSCVLTDVDIGFLDDVGHYSDHSVNGRLHSFLRDCLANPFEPTDPEEAARQAEAAREVCSLSLLHQADLRLRAIVSDWLAARSQRSEAEKAELGRLAASSKRALLNALRDGKLKVTARLNASCSTDLWEDLDTFLRQNISLPS